MAAAASADAFEPEGAGAAAAGAAAGLMSIFVSESPSKSIVTDEVSESPTTIGAVNEVNGGTGKPPASLTTSEVTPSPELPVSVAGASPITGAIWATVSAT